jgi:hypothetical protein
VKRFGNSVILLAVCSLLPIQALALDRQAVDNSILELKRLSKLERERFDRNLAAFQELSTDQKAQYRKLHDDLTADRKESGVLSSLMETYSVWLMTLSPAQRDELQQEKDTAKKIAIVRRFKEEQEHASEHHEVAVEETVAQAPPKNLARGAFDKKDLDAVFKLIVDGLAFDRKKSEFDDLNLNTYLPILQESMQQYGNNQEWPGDFLLGKMQMAVKKETSKEIGRSTNKRDAVVRMILMGVFKQASDQVREPSGEERIATALALSDQEKARIQRLPQQQVKWAIRKKYFETKGEEAMKQLSQLAALRRQVMDLFERLSVDPPPMFKKPDRPPRGKGS